MRTAASWLAGLAGIYGVCYVLSVMALGFALGDAPVTAASMVWVLSRALVLAGFGEAVVLLLILCACLIGWAWDS